jgi:response regulator RpfG family c-di-GMP phosphodiesterase
VVTGKEVDEMTFAPEVPHGEAAHLEPWKLLIADDEPEIHRVTKLALSEFTLENRPIQFLDAYTGHEAVGLMVEHPDVAMVLMDVVMETEHAGLDAIDAIRTKLKNKMVRIVLRTGQPGQAPESEVVKRYDINDYKEKTELTARKLFTVVYTGLSIYNDLLARQRSHAGLERIVDASSTIFRRRLPERLAKGALQLLASIFGIDQTAEAPRFGAFMATNADKPRPTLLAGIGRFEGLAGKAVDPKAFSEQLAHIRAIRDGAMWVREPRHFAACFSVPKQSDVAIWVEADKAFAPLDGHVLDVYCRNVISALHATQLHGDLERSQHDLIVMLSEAIEKRSKETGNHVRRVGEFTRLLGQLYGLNEEEADTLLLAAALHDVGKIAIPDAILGKPGKLTPEERAVMETHAEIGGQMLVGRDMPVLRAAMIIATQHHERWDGLGYPNKLQGEQIHLYGRMAGLADVFDALGSHRCYKKAWPLEDVLQTLRDERGRHFEPVLVDLFLDNLDQFLVIRDRFEDPAPAVLQ